MVLIAGGSGIIQALVAGDLPVAIVSGEPAILARLQGADTVMLGGLINIIDFTIITATEVKKPSDLKGKKLAVSRFGSSTDFVVRYALEKWDSLPIAMLRFSNSAANLRGWRLSKAVPYTELSSGLLPTSQRVKQALTNWPRKSNLILLIRILRSLAPSRR